MLYLKEANWEDREEEFTFLTQMPQDENGSINPCFGMTQGEFFTQGLPQMIDNAKGIGLPEGYVPATTYFLWENDKIVGKFNLRHRLSDTASGRTAVGEGLLPKVCAWCWRRPEILCRRRKFTFMHSFKIWLPCE